MASTGRTRLVVLACLVLACVAVPAAVGAGSPVGSADASTPPSPAHHEVHGDPTTIRTANGPVHGKTALGTRQFLGIPFAQPPVGDLRWKAPQPPAHWTTTLQATKTASACPQITPVINTLTGDENCLYLNVFAPKKVPSRALPVMVWIYGGGFTVGGAADDTPSNFAAHNGVVTVSFNYRLGPLGFLALPQLAAENAAGSTGDLGLLDQQAALRWVKANIADFGGDPGNVTIFGESAGGISVCAQLLSPGSAGLFEKGITESGPCTLPAIPLATAEATGAQLAATLDCPAGAAMLACMRSKPAAQVIEALPPDPSFLFGQGTAWDPVADGVVLPADPVAALRAGHFHRVPMIVGANRDEGRLFVALAFNLVGHPLTTEEWASTVAKYFGPSVGPQVELRYPLADYPDPGAAFGQAVGDATLACPAVQSAGILSKYVPVYQYEYDQTPNPFVLPTPSIALGAFHSSELPYVFDGSVESSGPVHFTRAQQKLATTVSAAWARFAKTGSPAGAGLTWPALGAPGGSYLSINTPTSVSKNMKQRVCSFWAGANWSLSDASAR